MLFCLLRGDGILGKLRHIEWWSERGEGIMKLLRCDCKTAHYVRCKLKIKLNRK